MIRDTLTLDTILLALENSLRIEYKDNNIIETIKQSKRRIENVYKVELNDSVYNIQASNRLMGDSLSIFMADVLESLKSFSLFLAVSMYDKKFSSTLQDVNYLGFAKHNILAALAVLQDSDMYSRRESFFPALTSRVSQLEMGQIRRLLTILILLENLGIEEGVAMLAQYLYAGCI